MSPPTPWGQQPPQVSPPTPWGQPQQPPVSSPPAAWGAPQQPAFGGFPPPSGPTAPQGYGAPGRPAKKKPVALLVALGVVVLLIIGVGVTLGVTQPWSGDSKTSKDDTTADKPTTVAGDLDGDGYGDVQALIENDYDSYRQVTGTSNGKRFQISTLTTSSGSDSAPVMVDFDGDGKVDPISYTYDDAAGDISFQSSSPGLQLTSSVPVDFSTLASDDYEGPNVAVGAGDVDGDGKPDLVISGQHGATVAIYVMLNQGEGKFGQPSRWAAVPNAIARSADIQIGDFDGDGKADVWGLFSIRKVTPKEYKDNYYGSAPGSGILKSTGSSFASPHLMPLSDASDLAYGAVLLAGDLTGSGRDSLVVVGKNYLGEGVTVTAYNVSTGGLVGEPGLDLTDSSPGKRELQGAVLSDVDGDGDADVVYLAQKFDARQFFGFRVIVSDGKRFEPSQGWGDVPPCTGSDCSLESMQ